jgi:hypothetical protein
VTSLTDPEDRRHHPKPKNYKHSKLTYFKDFANINSQLCSLCYVDQNVLARILEEDFEAQSAIEQQWTLLFA